MKYLVIGRPIDHSLSPVMMTAAFRAAGLDATYESREISPERMPAALGELHDEGIAGLNVTLPHKKAALAAAAEATERARSIGAANTLLRLADGWLAENTDGPGFLDWVTGLGRPGLLESEAVVVGAGGAARSVVWALLTTRCPGVRLVNRTRAAADAIAAEWGGRVRSEELTDLEAAPPRGLVVHCTSLGLRPDDPLPLPPASFARAAQLLDVVYPETPLVRDALARGIPAEDGVRFLVAQGARSFALWTGVAPDKRVMLAEIQAELARRSAAD
jgi:shikimate dehydrogenase